MKKGLMLALMLTIISCKDTTTTTQPETPTAPVERVSLEDTALPITTENKIVEKEEYLQVDVLLPMFYDKEFYGDEVNKIDRSWRALFEKEGQFQVRKVEYALTEEMNECTGSMAIGAFAKEEEQPLFFLSETTAIGKGIKESLPISKTPLWANTPQTYVFKGKTYVLRAEGKEINSYLYTDDEEVEKTYKQFDDYKLYLSIDGNEEQLLLDIPHFNDTFVQLLFVGDLDQDGKLDFIFDTSADYEQKRVEIYLSKDAKHNAYLAGTTMVDFAC